MYVKLQVKAAFAFFSYQLWKKMVLCYTERATVATDSQKTITRQHQ